MIRRFLAGALTSVIAVSPAIADNAKCTFFEQSKQQMTLDQHVDEINLMLMRELNNDVKVVPYSIDQHVVTGVKIITDNFIVEYEQNVRREKDVGPMNPEISILFSEGRINISSSYNHAAKRMASYNTELFIHLVCGIPEDFEEIRGAFIYYPISEPRKFDSAATLIDTIALRHILTRVAHPQRLYSPSYDFASGKQE